jgi:hypothetical protein
MKRNLRVVRMSLEVLTKMLLDKEGEIENVSFDMNHGYVDFYVSNSEFPEVPYGMEIPYDLHVK